MAGGKDTPPSLEEFAKTNSPRPGVPSWCDSLPEEVREQIISADASATTVLDWLESLGYEGGTVQKVDNWRRNMRQKRGWRPKS